MARVSFVPSKAPFEPVFKQDVFMSVESARLLGTVWNIGHRMRDQVHSNLFNKLHKKVGFPNHYA